MDASDVSGTLVGILAGLILILIVIIVSVCVDIESAEAPMEEVLKPKIISQWEMTDYRQEKIVEQLTRIADALEGLNGKLKVFKVDKPFEGQRGDKISLKKATKKEDSNE